MYRVLSMHVRCLRCGKHNVRIGRNDLKAAVSLHDASFSTISSLEHRAAFSNRSGEAQLATARTADAFTTVTSLRWRAQSRLSSVPLQSSWVSFFHTSIASLNPRQRKLDETVPPPLPEDHVLQPSKVTLGTANAKDGLTIDASSASPHTAAPSPSVSGAALTAETPGPEKRDLDGGSTSLSASSFLTGDGDGFDKTDCNAGPVSHSPSSVALTTDAWSSEKLDMPDSSLVEPSDFEDLLVVQKPASSLPEVSSSLTPYVSKSVTLANLVILGVDLSQVEKAPEAAEHLLKSDFDSEVKPYILFLHDLGISRDKLGKVITKNPLLFREHLDDLQVRVNYLEAKRFSPEAIAKVVTGAPLVLLMSVEKVDSKLGFLQSQFKLQGGWNWKRESISWEKLP